MIQIHLNLLSLEATALMGELQREGPERRLAEMVGAALGLELYEAAIATRPIRGARLLLNLKEAEQLRDWAKGRKASLEPATHAWRAVDCLGGLLGSRIMLAGPRKGAEERRSIPRKGLA
jgi:hypothetical protein